MLQLLQASKGKASGSPLQYLFARAQTYTLYIAPGRMAIVTMAPELSLLSRVDTTVRNKALLVPCGCQAFEQVSAVLLAGCRRKNRCGDAADAELYSSEVRHDSNRTSGFSISGLLLGSRAPPFFNVFVGWM